MHGPPSHVQTLYDKDGNAVRVSLIDGEYRLVVRDPELENKLDAILVALIGIQEALATRGEP